MKSLIIIPTYNERENIKELIPEILKLKLGINILIIDDNSPDGTGQIGDELAKNHREVKIIHKETRGGIAAAYIMGFKYAIEKNYDLIFEMDGDFSHHPKFLPDFLEKIKDYDLVIGSRYSGGGEIRIVNWNFKRILLSSLANRYAKAITGIPANDLTAGYNCFRRKALEGINFNKISSTGYSFQIEMKWHVYKKGLRITETPIIFFERKWGQSKLSANIICEGLRVLWKMNSKINK